MLSAISITEKFSDYLNVFIESKPQDESDMLYNYFHQHKNQWIRKQDLKSKNFVSWGVFPKWIHGEIETLKETFYGEGYILQEEKYSTNGIKYMLIDKEQLENIEHINIVEKMQKSKIYTPEEFDCLFSWSEHENQAKEYVPFTDTFSKFEIVIKNKKRYSAIQYKDNYRSGKNFDCEPNLIILDFDKGLKIETAQEIFKPFLNCISPTKSHRKEKNGQINDCFRVVLPCNPIPEKDYCQIMTNIINFYKSDPACKDKARYYDTCENTEVTYNDGFLFDWSVFKEAVPEPPQPQKKQVAKEMTFEDFTGTGKGLKESIGTSEADRLYQKAGISFTNGSRNNELSKVALWLKDMVKKNDITTSQAVDELWRLYHAMPDKTDFPTSEMKQLITSKFGSN